MPLIALQFVQIRKDILAMSVLEPQMHHLFIVEIVDIEHGKRTQEKDPHGRYWETFSPLARVGFYNPKEELLKRLVLPESKVLQTLCVTLPARTV